MILYIHVFTDTYTVLKYYMHAYTYFFLFYYMYMCTWIYMDLEIYVIIFVDFYHETCHVTRALGILDSKYIFNSSLNFKFKEHMAQKIIYV